MVEISADDEVHCAGRDTVVRLQHSGEVPIVNPPVLPSLDIGADGFTPSPERPLSRPSKQSGMYPVVDEGARQEVVCRVVSVAVVVVCVCVCV